VTGLRTSSETSLEVEMGTPRRNIVTAVVLVALFGGSARSVWRVKAQNGAPRVPVQKLPERMGPAVVTTGDRGATYHALETTAVRVTTRFADAVATAERGPDGKLSTSVKDLAGNEIALFRVHRVDADRDSLEFAIPGRTARHMTRRQGLRATLDWSNEQAYSLWKDRGAPDSSALEWQDALVRPVGAPKRSVGAEVVLTETEWASGFSASVTKKMGTHISYLTGRKTTGLVFISSFSAHGAELGSSQWWPEEQTFAWSFPGLTEGYLDAHRLQKAGGWTFTPDMAWMKTQSLAFYRFHSLAEGRGSAAERRAGWLDRLGAFIAPAVRANEVGCDGLHWLDGSIFRPCCDSHDICYAKEGCTASTWWMWWSSWRCDACNAFAVFCFASGGGGHVFFRFP
jgi:hypothetical protein